MRQLKRVAAGGLLAITAGCMQYLVQPPAPEIAGSPRYVHAKSYLGSELQQPPYVLATECEGREQLSRVIVKRDFWQGFVSWISLGLIAPATIRYECAIPAGGGDLGNSSDGGGDR